MPTLLEGNIVYGGPITVRESFKYKSLGHYVMDKLYSFSNSPNKKDSKILINGVTGQEYTPKYFYNSILRMSYILHDLNIGHNDVIALSAENRLEFAIVLFAAFAVNATVAPLNVTYSKGEIEHAINLSKPKVIFASKASIDLIAAVVKSNQSNLHHIQIIGFDNLDSKTNILPYKMLMQKKRLPANAKLKFQSVNKDGTIALIVCSSGTTGIAKGVQLSQANVLSTADAQLEPSSIDLNDFTTLNVIPWFHSFGCLTLILSVCMGACLVYLPRFEEHSFLRSIEKYRIKMAFMVPPLMVFLAKHPIVDKYDLSSLLILLSGAAPLSKETENLIKERIGVPIIRQGYGLSESTLSLLVQTDDNCKPGSVGALKVGVYAKVIDCDTGKILGPNQVGELCFKGDYIMKGYIGDVKSTQSTVIDGWLHTGDMGYFDNDLEFFIVDRIKELIKYKGYQVPPAEIEAILLSHPKIKDAAVVGKADEMAGELPMAFVVKQAGVELSQNEVINFVAERTSPAKHLRGGVQFVKEIPKNPSGKILRRILRDMTQLNTKSKL